MPNNQYSIHRRIFITCHKIVLDRSLLPRLQEMEGDVLIVGAGMVSYRMLMPAASSVCITDIGPMHEGLDHIADAHELPFEDESFDAVVAVEVFEHLHHPAQAAAELRRVLRPGARGLISIPFLFRIHGDPHDYQRFTRSGLKVLFGDFSSVRITSLGSRRHVISDIVTTVAPLFAALRIFNHVLAAPFLPNRPSRDCPSGFLVELRK